MELAQLVRSVTIRSVFGSHAAVPTPEAPRESLVVSGVRRSRPGSGVHSDLPREIGAFKLPAHLYQSAQPGSSVGGI